MIAFTLHNQISAGEYTRFYMRSYIRKPRLIPFILLYLSALVLNIGHALGLVDERAYAWLPWPWLFLFPALVLLNVAQARSIYKRSPRLKEPVDYTFTEEEVRAKTGDTEWTYKWGSVVKTKDTREFLLIYRSAAEAELIKKIDLTPEQLDFLKIKTGKYSI